MPDRLGRYEIIKKLGEGTMGIVYLAHDPRIDRPVAVKSISLDALSDDQKQDYRSRLEHEAKAAGRLTHPNIVTIFDAGEHDGSAYIAMEFLGGRELASLLEAGPLPVDRALDIALQVSSGLCFADKHHIVHRDIKPSNIMVLDGNQVKLVDFGIAKMPVSLVKTQAGMVIGSPLYMSPEQISGKSVSKQSDIYSLGVVLYQMLTGQLPLNAGDFLSIAYKVVNEIPERPSRVDYRVPDMLDPIVMKCLEKNPQDRYRNPDELLHELHACRQVLLDAQARLETLKRLKKVSNKTIFQLVYESTPYCKITTDVLTEILTKSQYKNLRLNLTGLLVFHHGKFIQLLEGDEQDVRELFDIIKQDARHQDVKILFETNSSNRAMPSWVMGFASSSKIETRLSSEGFYIPPDMIREICDSLDGELKSTFANFFNSGNESFWDMVRQFRI